MEMCRTKTPAVAIATWVKVTPIVAEGNDLNSSELQGIWDILMFTHSNRAQIVALAPGTNRLKC